MTPRQEPPTLKEMDVAREALRESTAEMASAANRQEFERALGLANEIAEAEENQPAGWYEYPWEHLGDAMKDVHVLIRGLRAAKELIPNV